jgi:hypothetical protein
MGLQRGVEPRLKAPQALVLAVTPQQPRKDNQFGYQLKGFRGAESEALLEALTSNISPVDHQMLRVQ